MFMEKMFCYNTLGGARHVFFTQVFEIWYTPLFFLSVFYFFIAGSGSAGRSRRAHCANFSPMRGAELPLALRELHATPVTSIRAMNYFRNGNALSWCMHVLFLYFLQCILRYDCRMILLFLLNRCIDKHFIQLYDVNKD